MQARSGSTLKPRSIEEAFARLFRKTSKGCWEWQGALRDRKYGNFRGKLAHRVSYEMTNGQIPSGLCLLHRCNNTLCVNPDHLVPGTHQTNMQHRVGKIEI